MLDFEGGGDATFAALEPEHVDQPDGIGAGQPREAGWQFLAAPIAEPAGVERPISIVRGDVGAVEFNAIYLHQLIMPPLIIPPPKTRTSSKTTMTVPMMITAVLGLLVVLFMR